MSVLKCYNLFRIAIVISHQLIVKKFTVNLLTLTLITLTLITLTLITD
ncbi:hypothetical protein PL10110_560036 [Planktothrix agardhii]|nr:hypothetical protein PL10110_560036 [Planktothrix agardhii]